MRNESSTRSSQRSARLPSWTNKESFIYSKMSGSTWTKSLGLGSFLEFEAVLSSSEDEQAGRNKVSWLIEEFQIETSDLLANLMPTCFSACQARVDSVFGV